MAEMVDPQIRLVVSARLKVQPAARETFLSLALAAVAATRTEEGCISYTLFEEAGAPNSFIFFEEWRSRAALAAHMRQPYIAKVLEALPALLDGTPDMRLYDVARFQKGLADIE